MRLHTALHVMSCVVVAPVTGGNIAPDKARLDFDIDMSLLDADEDRARDNALIARGVDDGDSLDHRRELDARPELVKTMTCSRRAAAGACACCAFPGSTCSRAAARTSPDKALLVVPESLPNETLRHSLDALANEMTVDIGLGGNAAA